MESSKHHPSILRGHAIKPRGILTWRKSWARPYESHLSIAWRAIQINVISAETFRSFLFMKRWRNILGPTNLLSEINAVQRSLSIDDPLYCPASDRHFIANSRPEDLLSKSLRFCPACSAEAYHSLLFQVNDIAKCPLHWYELLTRCPECLEVFPSCSLSGTTLSHPWGCARCGWPQLKQMRISETAWKENSIDRARSFGPVASEIFRVISIADTEPWINSIQFQGYAVSRACAFRLAAKWLNASPYLKDVLPPTFHQLSKVVMPSTQGDAGLDSANDSAIRAYLHIRRRAVREIKNERRNCPLSQIADANDWKWDAVTASSAPARPDISAEYLAFHLWRAAHEKNYVSSPFPTDADRICPPIYLNCIHRSSATTLKNSYPLWAAYFHTSWTMYRQLSRRWRIDLDERIAICPDNSARKQATLDLVWAEHAPFLHASPASGDFPIRVIAVSGDSAALPIGTVIFFSVIPPKPIWERRLFPHH